MGKNIITSIIGKVVEVRPIMNKGKGQVQEILLRRTKYAGNNSVQDNYPMVFFGDKIEKYHPESLLGKWINVTVYINGKSYPNEHGKIEEKVVLSVKDLIQVSK